MSGVHAARPHKPMFNNMFSKSAASKLLQMNRGLAGSNNC